MDDFKNDLINWTEHDIEINKLKTTIGELNNLKKEKENKIIDYIKNNQLESQTFELPNFNYKITYKNQKISESYSIKYLTEKLSNYFKEKELSVNVEECMNYLKENRSVVIKPIIKTNN